MPIVSKEYKDRLFCFLFGNEENREWTLDLYNAVNGSNYTDPEAIQINTIREVIYLGMHNDVSFLLADEMNLYEQQSTYNPNMPLRMLQYTGNLFEKYLKENKFNKYGRELIPLPVPRLVVFYNGEDDRKDEVILRLSDSFRSKTVSDVEVTVRMLNINIGRNQNLMTACRPLMEYSWLVQEVRKNRKGTGKEKGMEIGAAVDQAISDMPRDFILRKFLDAHRVEVRDMLLTEYDEMETMRLFELDGERRGEKKGAMRMASLISKLIALGRSEDVERAANDEDYRKTLFKEFNL